MGKEKPKYKTPEEIRKQLEESNPPPVPMEDFEKLIEKAVNPPKPSTGKK